MAQENLRSLSAHILGIVSLVLAFFNPVPALILGIVGLVQSTKQKDARSNRAKILNIIAIIVSVLLIAAAIVISRNPSILGNIPLV